MPSLARTAGAIEEERLLKTVDALCEPSTPYLFSTVIYDVSGSVLLPCVKHVPLDLLLTSSPRSTELFAALNELRKDPKLAPAILGVRGKDLMVAVEFASPVGSSPYDTSTNPSVLEKLASRVASNCVEKGLLILTTSVHEVVRFIPPLNISKEDPAKGVEIFKEAVYEVVKDH
ncbi:hypothetical protein BD310DRAFT_920269 [Dichomitus squalens]|uniref:Pyridoxal phosphate-dependent transferase n=1 Tax=Dichomitus squalens TaxID=114155 RepID=A0A4Q9Q342_9APHY|nr:hypothetical protein BD310DRAFT_920269 [Dichomitus squalens]